MNRDWNKNPPETHDDYWSLARQCAEHTCDLCFEHFGERPHPEEKGDSIFIVWPDGQITNEIKINRIH